MNFAIFGSIYISRSPYPNNQHESRIFVYLLYQLVNIGKIKVLNQDNNSSKNANITLYTQKNKNTLQHLKLGKLKFGIGKIGCLMS